MTGHQKRHSLFIHSTYLLFLPCIGYRSGPFSHFVVEVNLAKPKILEQCAGFLVSHQQPQVDGAAESLPATPDTGGRACQEVSQVKNASNTFCFEAYSVPGPEGT